MKFQSNLRVQVFYLINLNKANNATRICGWLKEVK